MLILSYDADNAGRKVGRAIIANDEHELHRISAKIDLGHQLVNKWIADHGGERISGGGDEGCFKVSYESAKKIEELREKYFKTIGLTISIGIGKTLSKSGLSLVAAKLDGKNKTVWFGLKVKKIIEKSKKKVEAGNASVDEMKITEAYLEKSENMLCNLHKGSTADYIMSNLTPRMMESNPNGHFVAHSGKRSMNAARKLESEGKIHSHTENKHGIMFHPNHKSACPDCADKPESLKSDLHKHEEGFHDSAATKEGVANFNPDNEDNRTDDCAYCQDLDAQENADGTAGMHNCDMCRQYDVENGTSGGMDDCPACKEYDTEQQTTGGIDDCPMCNDYDQTQGGDGCPACVDYDAGKENITEVQANPEQEPDHICNCPNCPHPDQTDLAVQDMGAEHPDNCPDCQEMYSDAVENEPGQTGQGDPNLQGHETAEEVLDMLDAEPGSTPTPAQAAKQIDNTELPQGKQMRENVSVKDNFGDAQKADIPDSDQAMNGQQENNSSDDANDNSPDMASVLQGGLDEHAQDQQKQQVLDMVSQTLQGFKANKASLEATKEQNQPLYNSCIQMLKSMIELCKLLGLQPKAIAPQDAGAVAEATQSDAPNEQKQAGPPQAAPSEGAAQAPKAQG
jgi:hypothetical protein